MYEFKTKPYQHQLNALRASWGRKEYAFFMEMGTGKTKVSIDSIGAMYEQGLIDGALIVAPKGVYRNWYKEFDKHLPERIDLKIAHWDPYLRPHEKENLNEILTTDRTELHVFLVNVEAYSRLKNKITDLTEEFLSHHKTIMIVDESTTIKSHTAKRTKNVIKLGTLAKYRRVLTGAPITRDPMDLYSQCEFLGPYLLGHSSYYGFRNTYAILAKRSAGGHVFQQITGYQNLDTLKEKVAKFSFRVRKDECLDLPPKIYMTRSVPLTEEQKKAYAQMKENAMAIFEEGEVTALAVITVILRLHQIVCGYLPLDLSPEQAEELYESGELANEPSILNLKNNRMTELLEILEEVEGKAVIWAVYRKSIHDITEAVEKRFGEGSIGQFYGGNHKTRLEHHAEFEDPNSDMRFLVANRAAAYGIDLLQATTVIYFANTYDLDVRAQSEDRSHRVGQTKPVTYIDMVSEGTVDEAILKSHQVKKDLARTIIERGPSLLELE